MELITTFVVESGTPLVQLAALFQRLSVALLFHVVVALLTVIDGLVLAVFVGSVMSEAVTVAVVPPVFSVTLKFFVPAANAASAGNVALASLEVM